MSSISTAKSAQASKGETRRHGAAARGHAGNLLRSSREDILDFAPLNTPEGRAQIEAVILRIGGVEFIVFDNIMSLLVRDMKDESSAAGLAVGS